ncbi:Hypothetical predicted protein [Mytilus galloprovincialis]|uniref:Endonuclease/exonuclease/phosphatase domain-containing protein n=1 Tax=Mytilus galloprovincialis TaxID=29158 RepID=A0A8B6H1B2_MYTGA|nr:Hypothetical predicted protein [Mytilus galloprovincialis]
MADQVIKEKQQKQQQSNIVSYFKNTPKHSGKRDQPSSSPDNSSPSMQQVEKLARLVNLDTSLSDSSLPNSDSTENIISSVEKETVFKLSDVVCATLKNQEFMDSIIPLITEKVIEMVKPKIVQIVDECMQPHLLSIKHNKDALILKDVELNKYKEEMKMLKTKLGKVEARIEEQEQYSRRTSLRFHNVPVPTDDNGDIIKPINTDALVLDICNKNLKLNLNTRDIGRSHPIGEIKDGKIAIIVRFLSYRQRQLVFNSKRYLKGNKSKIFIAENLTNTVLLCLLLICGDIEPNPGPERTHEYSEKTLSIFHCNIESLRNKLNYIADIIEDYDVVFFTETHLDSNITDYDISIMGFETPVRKDRNSHGGGIIMYFKNYVHIIRRQDLEHDEIESDLNKNFMSDLPSNIRDIIFINGLINIIDKATHFDTRTSSSSSLLDPILVTDSIPVLDKDTIPIDRGISDHDGTYVTIDCGFSKSRTYIRSIWDYKRGDYDLMKQKVLNTNWENLISDASDVHVAATNFTNTFINIASACIPTRERNYKM